MMYSDDDIRRILDGTTGPDPEAPLPDPDSEVYAETVIRVPVNAFLGTMLLHVTDVTTDPACDTVLLRVADASYLHPLEHELDCLTLRKDDLRPFLRALEKAVARAEAMGLVPVQAAA